VLIEMKTNGIYASQDDYLIGKKSFYYSHYLFPLHFPEKGAYFLQKKELGIEVEAKRSCEVAKVWLKRFLSPNKQVCEHYYTVTDFGIHILPYKQKGVKEGEVKSLTLNEVLVIVFPKDIVFGGNGLIVKKLIVPPPATVIKWLSCKGQVCQKINYNKILKILNETRRKNG